ncbi:MAG TPA: universal stress protein [Anaerolineales bacterium]|nr:universal stress protein [Anaerolineales bacterium]
MTIKNILVPLDGSQLSETVLPMAALLARQNHARLILLHVIEENPPEKVHGEHHLTNDQEAANYLAQVSQSLSSDLEIERHVHTNAEKSVAQSIVAHSQELKVDLIAMCAHGQSGLQKLIFGNIAQSVLNIGDVPVLLLSPEKEMKSETCNCQCILVPLDGNPDHEAGLDMAVELSQNCHAKLHLVMVIHKLSTLPGEQAASAMLLPTATSVLLEMDCEEGEIYLAGLMGKLLDKNIPVTGEVQRGDPAKQIVRAAREFQADMIVLGTHSKTAMDAFWSGSVTPKIATQTHLPLLLVPVHDGQQPNENVIT